MNIFSLTFGALLCILSLYVQYRRLTDRSRKMPLMQKIMGRKMGSYWHFAACVVLPSITGLVFIYYGLNGRGVTDVLYLVNLLFIEENIALLF